MFLKHFLKLRDPLRNNLATWGPKTLNQIEQFLLNDFQYLNNKTLETPKIRLPGNPPARFLINRFPTDPVNVQNNNHQQNQRKKNLYTQTERTVHESDSNVLHASTNIPTKQSKPANPNLYWFLFIFFFLFFNTTILVPLILSSI